MLNRVSLIGRLTRDPELKYTPNNNTAVCSFTLAIDRNRKNAQGEKETDFVNIVVWSKSGETCAQYLAKGKLAAVDGRLQIRNYTDKDGNRRTIAEVVADHVDFLSPKDGQGAGYGGANSGLDESDPAGFMAQQGQPLSEEDVPF